MSDYREDNIPVLVRGRDADWLIADYRKNQIDGLKSRSSHKNMLI